MKIKVVQYMWGEQNVCFSIIRQINEAYCRAHNYEFVVYTEPPRSDRNFHYGKIPVLREALCDCDYLLYLDADAFFYSREMTVRNELLPFFRKEIMFAPDCMHEGDRERCGTPNAGVILVKNTERAAEILRLWNESSERADIKLCNGTDQYGLCQSVWKECNEDIHLIQEYYLMNASYGLFICHLAGMTDRQRLCRLQKYANCRDGCEYILEELKQKCPDLCIGCQDVSRLRYNCQMKNE